LADVHRAGVRPWTSVGSQRVIARGPSTGNDKVCPAFAFSVHALQVGR
jgi:hypothetical protein